MRPGNLITSIGIAEMLIYYVVLGASILAGIGGQMLLKAAADAPTLVEQVLRPTSIFGLALYGSAAFMYMFRDTQNSDVGRVFQASRCPTRSWPCSPTSCSASHSASSRRGGIALIMGGVILINQT